MPPGSSPFSLFQNVDNARIAQAAVTIVKAGDITYSGFSPTVAPQGGLQQDIFLAATNATSQLGVTVDLTDSNCTAVKGVKTIDPSQIKVVFAPARLLPHRSPRPAEHLAASRSIKNPWVLSSAGLQQQHFDQRQDCSTQFHVLLQIVPCAPPSSVPRRIIIQEFKLSSTPLVRRCNRRRIFRSPDSP